MKTDFLHRVRQSLRDNQYQADREDWKTRALYWAMRRPTRMYLLIVAAFIVGVCL